MLYLIGLGLGNEKDLTLSGIEIAKRCECFCELYTSAWSGSIKDLEKLIGKEMKQLKRSDLEENLQTLLNLAKQKDIAIFVPGDPLAATTHISLVIEARKQEIPVKIIHNASIFSAISECGLQLYKFGKTVTVPLSGKLQAVADAIAKNKSIGLHTLLLLDIKMTVAQAIKLLQKEKIIKDEMLIAARSIGTDEQKIIYAKAEELIEKNILPPAVLILPGQLHFKEKEFLEMIK